MDQQFLAAFRQLTLQEFISLFPQPIANRLWNRYTDALKVDELQLYLLSLKDEQQFTICKAIKARLHPLQVEIQGRAEALVSMRDYMLDHGLHFTIKQDLAPRSDRTGYADWSILTNADAYKRWLSYASSNK